MTELKFQDKLLCFDRNFHQSDMNKSYWLLHYDSDLGIVVFDNLWVNVKCKIKTLPKTARKRFYISLHTNKSFRIWQTALIAYD